MTIKLHEPTFGEEEIAAATEVMRSTMVTQGEKVAEFEEAFAAKYGFERAVAVNSGSSANLLAITMMAERLEPVVALPLEPQRDAHRVALQHRPERRARILGRRRAVRRAVQLRHLFNPHGRGVSRRPRRSAPRRRRAHGQAGGPKQRTRATRSPAR